MCLYTALFFYLYTRDILQHIKKLDSMDIFSTLLAYSCRRKNIKYFAMLWFLQL